MLIVENAKGYSSELGYVGGLTVTQTVYGYVGMLKSYEKQEFVEKGDFKNLISISFQVGDDFQYLDNVKINFVDQFGHVFFCCFNLMKI